MMKSKIFYIFTIFLLSQFWFIGCESKTDGISSEDKIQGKKEKSPDPAGNWVYQNLSGWEFRLSVSSQDQKNGTWFMISDEFGNNSGSYELTKDGKMSFYEEGILVANGRITETTLYYDTPNLGSIPFKRE